MRKELFDSMATQNAEIRTVAKSLPLFLKQFAKSLFFNRLSQTDKNLKYKRGRANVLTQPLFVFPKHAKKRQNITVRGGAKGEDKRWSENLHQFRVFLTDLQCFAYQENADGFLLLSNEKL